MAEQRQHEKLSREEPQQPKGEKVPDKEPKPLVDPNDALPINAAVATNVLSDYAAPARMPRRTRSSSKATSKREKQGT
jgi:hypothetical protein